MKKNINKNKGFTLVELLVTILIISIITSVGYFFTTNIINSSKEKSDELSINNIKTSARTYSKEYPDNLIWKADGENYYACITIQDLINAGYYKKEQLPKKLNGKSIILTKNSSNTIINEEIDESGGCELPSNQYMIKFRGNGSTSGSMTDLKCIRGQYCALTKNNFTRTGYKFLGWAISDSGKVLFDDNEKVKDIAAKNSSLVTLYAVWKPNNIYIKYHINGGSITPKTTDINNYINKWTTAEDGTIRINDKFYYTAKYGETLDAGLANYNNKNFIYIAKDYHHAKVGEEWCTKANGTGTCYDQATKLENLGSGTGKNQLCDARTTDCTIDLYVNWVPNKVYFRFHPNGGTVKTPTSNGSTTYRWTTDSEGFLKVNNAYWGGNGFKYDSTLGEAGFPNWNNNNYLYISKPNYTSVTGQEWCKSDGDCYSHAQDYKMEELCKNIKTSSSDCTVKLYVNWASDPKFTVAYNANGGTGTTASHTCTINGACTLKANGFTRTGYTFTGWKKDNTGDALAVGASIKNATTSGKTVTYYAQWSINKLTINYNANGGTGTIASHTANYNTNYTLKANGFTRKGYTFTGWNTRADGKGTAHNAGASIKNTSTTNLTITYYAQWRINVVTVKYNVNGGTLTAKTGSNNWSKDSSGIIKQNGNVYTQKFNYNSSAGANGIVNYNNKKYIKITKIGHHVASGREWCSGTSANGTCYNQDANYSGLGTSSSKLCDASRGDCTVTLYVGWKTNTVTVKYRVNNGTLTAKTGKNKWTTNSYGTIKKNGDIFVQIANYNTKIGANGLVNYNNSNYINISRSGYYVDSGEEWCTGTSADGTCYSQSTNYTAGTSAENLCDARNNSCDVYLYVGWKKIQTSSSSSSYSGGGGGSSSGSSSSSSSGCFLANTKITTPNGLKNISKIKVNDLVLTYNENTNSNEYHKVAHVLEYNPKEINEELYTLKFDDKTILKVTSTHRFYIKREGKYLWLPTKDIVLNDMVMYSNKENHKIISISKEKLKEKVYNLSVNNTHNFYVGKKQILVHNFYYCGPSGSSQHSNTDTCGK